MQSIEVSLPLLAVILIEYCIIIIPFQNILSTKAHRLRHPVEVGSDTVCLLTSGDVADTAGGAAVPGLEQAAPGGVGHCAAHAAGSREGAGTLLGQL